MNVKSNIPKLRFQGFSDDWEQRKLKEVTERVRGNDGRMDLPTLTISAGSGWLDQRERFSNNIAGKEQKNYTLLHKGELSYNHGNSKLAKYGAVFELTTYEEALVPRVYHSFKTNDSSSCFIEYMFATKRPDRELGKLVSSGARMDGLLNINFDEFMGINIILPSTNEQNKISEFLRKLDFTLTLHQRKLDKLKQLKQGYLQQLFPENGEKVPKVRFANFEHEWEQCKLGKIVKWSKGNNLAKSVLNENKIGDSVIHYADLYKFSPVVADVIHWSESGQGTIIPNNSLLFPMSDVTPVGLARTSTITKTGIKAGGDTLIGTIDEGLIAEFISYQINANSNKILPLVTGTTVRHISSSSLSTLDVMIPTKLEQRKISDCLNNLEYLITLHQAKLDNMKSIKQSLLQKMFI